MNDILGGILAATLLLFLGLSLIFVPWLLGKSYLLKRDCELLSKTECVWKMMPAPPSQN